MNEKDFENLLSMAKSNDLDSVNLARTIVESSDLPQQDKNTILRECIRTTLSISINQKYTKSLYPFKNK